MKFINTIVYKVYNNVEDKIIFVGTADDFVKFANIIKDENSDTYTINNTNDALKYIEVYCGNLDLIK